MDASIIEVSRAAATITVDSSVPVQNEQLDGHHHSAALGEALQRLEVDDSGQVEAVVPSHAGVRGRKNVHGLLLLVGLHLSRYAFTHGMSNLCWMNELCKHSTWGDRCFEVNEASTSLLTVF